MADTVRFRAIVTLTATAFRADRRRACVVLLLAPAAGAMGSLIALSIKLATNAAVHRDASAALVAAGLLAVTAVTGNLLGDYTAGLRIYLQERVALRFDQQLIRMVAAAPTLINHEHPEYLDKMDLVRSNRGQLGGGFGALVENLRSLAMLATTLALLATVQPSLLALPLFALPAIAAARRGNTVEMRTEQDTAAAERLRRALLVQACTSSSAEELRVYRLGGEISRRHDELLEHVITSRGKAERRAARLVMYGWLVFACAYLAAVFIALQAALHGHGNAGQVMLTVTLGAQLLGSVSGQVSLGQWLQGSLRAVGYYLWLADSTAAASRPSGPAVLPVPDQAGSGLVVDNVSFSYPGTQAPVLREVSLRIPAGSTVAIVGDNGAGKTTLIKLLCRMYEPTAGAITFGGRDIAALDPEAWRGHIAAGFQDFCRFELTVRAAVGVGDLPRATDDAAVSAALHRAGAESLPAELPAGLDTQLGASYPGGVDLSTGQWQKIAVARAMMRDTPALLILDEPTASLDAATEYTLLASYADAIRATGRDMITVLVSHRFSAARLADIIVVLADGQIRETGSHEELTARGGLYDELYRLSQQNLAATASP